MTFLTPSIISLQVFGESTLEFDAQTAATEGKLTLSDHSRSPLSVRYDVIEKFSRMADGTARKQIVSKKKVFSCAWDMLPTVKNHVADSKSDALDIKLFFETYAAQPMTLSLYHSRNADSTTGYVDTFNVFFTQFDYDVIKRFYNFDYWNISIELLEI